MHSISFNNLKFKFRIKTYKVWKHSNVHDVRKINFHFGFSSTYILYTTRIWMKSQHKGYWRGNPYNRPISLQNSTMSCALNVFEFSTDWVISMKLQVNICQNKITVTHTFTKIYIFYAIRLKFSWQHDIKWLCVVVI